jgi:putative drug exporter of the RND superfamily
LATTEDRRILDAAQPDDRDALRLSKLYRWGLAVARRRRLVLGISVVLFVMCSGAGPVLQKELGAPSLTIEGSESARVEKLIDRLFPLGSEDDVVVFHSGRHVASDQTYRAAIAAVDKTVRDQTGVRSVVGPYDATAVGQILAGEHTALSLITIGGSANQRFNNTSVIQAAMTRAAGDSGVRAWLTGSSPITKELTSLQKIDTQHAEAIGVPVAFMILLFALGGLAAAFLPLLMAVAGLLLTYGVLAILAHFLQFDSFLLAMVTLIGLGIGIDYSLFIVSRFREELARSDSGEHDESDRVADAVGVALATSGRTILFSGVVVALSLSSLFVVQVSLFREIAIGAVVVVACMLAAAMTLLPATLALLGPRINRGALPRRLRPWGTRSRAGNGPESGWSRWARLTMRRPILVIVVAGGLLLVAAIPALHLRYGYEIGVPQSTPAPAVEAENLLRQEFSLGVMGPIEVVVTGNGGMDSDVAIAQSVSQELERDQRVTVVTERRSANGVLLTVIPAVPIDSVAITALVRHLRNDVAPRLDGGRKVTVFVGGPTAQIVDGTNELSSKFPLIIALIVGLSALFLLMVFRSVVLPIKAVLLNLLGTAATVGLSVWIFQYGHGQQLLDFTSTGYVQFTVPTVMFVLLFGLSMDYEIFLIRRVQEEWRKTGDNTLAVATAMEHTGPSITAAAAIMVAVFGCFMTADLLELKQLGFALAAAIALDATLIRLVLVPATMGLLGAWNWWLPRWLERWLPKVGVD